jgi:hypothetical protein
MLTALVLSLTVVSVATLVPEPNSRCPGETWRVQVAYAKLDGAIAFKDFIACSRGDAEILKTNVDEHGFWLEDSEPITHIAHAAVRQVELSLLR